MVCVPSRLCSGLMKEQYNIMTIITFSEIQTSRK